MKDLDVRDLQRQKNELRLNLKNNRNNEQLDQLRNVRNNLKLKVINKLLHPRQKRMDVDPDEINKLFNSTAMRTMQETSQNRSLKNYPNIQTASISVLLRTMKFRE
eukprot:TCONS_00053042-protein